MLSETTWFPISGDSRKDHLIKKAIYLNLRTFCNPRYICLSESERNSRSNKLEVKGFKHMLKEISIVNILKQLRVLQAAAR